MVLIALKGMDIIWPCFILYRAVRYQKSQLSSLIHFAYVYGRFL